MYIFRGTDPEEPIISSGQICTFESMQVRSVLLDAVLKDPENPMDDLVVDLDIKVSYVELTTKPIVIAKLHTVCTLCLLLCVCSRFVTHVTSSRRSASMTPFSSLRTILTHGYGEHSCLVM